MFQYPRATVFTCTEYEKGKRCVYTAQVGTISREWLTRYEATNYCILYVYVPDLYPTRSGSVWILDVDDLEINGGTGPRAVLCLAISPGMDAVHAGLLSNHQSVICTSLHACSLFQLFDLASLLSHMSRLR